MSIGSVLVRLEKERDRLRKERDSAIKRAEQAAEDLRILTHARQPGSCQCSDDEACAHVRRAEKAEAEILQLKNQLMIYEQALSLRESGER